MPNPTTAAEWAKKCSKAGHLRDVSIEYESEEYDLLCTDCTDAYARQQVDACYQVLVNEAGCDHAGLGPADPAAFKATLDQIIYSKVEAFRERAIGAIPVPPKDDDESIKAYFYWVVESIRALDP
mgnify:FL=1